MALNRVEADTDVENHGSMRVLEKVGFQREGLQHEQFNLAAQPKDLHLFNETTHFMFADAGGRVRPIVKDWLDLCFPA